MRFPPAICRWYLAGVLTLAGGIVRPALAEEDCNVNARIIPADAFRNFLKNWDEAKNPVRMAWIRTPAEYDTLYHPAPVLGPKKPFAPPPEFFEKEQILVVARVIKAPAEGEKVFSLEKIITHARVLEMHYRFLDPKSDATWSMKSQLAVAIPRQDIDRVRFLENGKSIDELNAKDGQWAIPPPAQDKAAGRP